MSQVNQFKIENLDNSQGLKFHYAEGYQDNITINSVNFAIPGQSADNNFVGNFGGFTRLINVDFVLMDDGTDKSTDGSSKVTLTQQRQHLMSNVIQGQSTGFSNVTFRVTLYENDTAATYIGMVEDVSVSPTMDRGNTWAGNLRLRIGTN